MSLYTEKSTSLLYEAKLFDDFVIVRPVTPGFEMNILKVSHVDFDKDFEEYSGRHDEIYDFLGGSGIELPVTGN